MLCLPSPESVVALGRFLRDAGYNVASLHDRLGLSDLPHPNLQNLEMLLYRTAGQDVLSVLARLFFVSEPTSIEDCLRFLPQTVFDTCSQSGLLQGEEPGFVRSPYALLPFASAGPDNVLVACDAVWTRSGNAEVILGPSQTTILLSKFLVRTRAAKTLDVGTGTGVLAIDAASYSNHVLATDINPRGVAFTQFNAALNGVSRLSTLQGDAFVPVGEERFNRIIANPPFFLSPSKTVTFCDSPVALDGFCRRLAREAPAHLDEGGIFQMICEWVHIEGESGEQRLKEWTAGSGCDVLVLQGTRLTPLDYASKRLSEGILLYSGQHQGSFVERMAYFAQSKVEAIVGGVISMRKRSGNNWFCMSAMPDAPDLSAGPAVSARFAALDLIFVQPESQLLESKLKLTAGTVLEQHRTFRNGEWQVTSLGLRSVDGFKDRLGLDPTVAEITGLFNGQRTLAEIAAAVSQHLNLPADEAARRCLHLAKRLLTGNLIELA